MDKVKEILNTLNSIKNASGGKVVLYTVSGVGFVVSVGLAIFTSK